MADLPRDIGFDDDPVILINYVTLDDQKSTSSLQSPSHTKPHPETSPSYGGCFRGRSKSSSTSELSAFEVYEMTESTENLMMDSKKAIMSSTVARDINHDPSSQSHSSLRITEGEESCSDSLEQVDSPFRLDLKKLQEQNKELTRKNHKLSLTLDALRKERELLVCERDRLKQEKREGQSRFTKKVAVLCEDANSLSSKEDSEVSFLQQQLASRDQEIASLHQKFLEVEKESEVKSKSSSLRDEEGIVEEDRVGSSQHKSTLNKLIEEQTISSNLRSNNSQLQLRVASLESEIENLHKQNSHNLILVERANAAAQAATDLLTTNTKQRKKSSLFGIRRSGRKKTSMDSPTKTPSNSSKNPLSTSQPSLDGSLSEHDLNIISTKKSEGASAAFPYNPFNKPPDVNLLQTSIKLAMEEKVEVERQLACLRDELDAHQTKLEELMQDNARKERIYVDAVQEMERTKQALQLTTREKELLTSENEGLCFEIASVSAEKDALKGKEVKAVLKEKQEMEFLRSENKALMSEIRTLIINSDGLETSLSQLKREKVAKDVRDHEMKLKLKKADQENKKLRDELTQFKQLMEQKDRQIEELKAEKIEALKATHESPKITIFRNSESPPREKHSPSTGQQQVQTPDKKQIGPSVFIDDSFTYTARARSISLHERAVSEDYSPSIKPHNHPMQRTSSGGTKVIAVQATLPTKETPLKVADKALLSTSLPFDTHTTKLGTFKPLSPKSSDVNSLVKMFETRKPKGEQTKIAEEKNSTNEDSKAPAVSKAETHKAMPSSQMEQEKSSSSSRETTPSRRSSINRKDSKSPSRERKLSSTRRRSQSTDSEETTHKTPERKRNSTSSRSNSPSPKKLSSTGSHTQGTSGSSKNIKQSSKEDSTNLNQSSPSKVRKNSSGGYGRKLSHGSSEAKYLPRKDELKEPSHRRTTSLVITKDISSTSVEQKKSKDSCEISTNDNKSHQDSSDANSKKLKTIAEKSTANAASSGSKTTGVSKHISRYTVSVEDNNVSPPTDNTTTSSKIRSNSDAKVKLSSSSEKSQTWPIKTSSETTKKESATNTLPSSGKVLSPVENKSISPTQLTTLGISKPKPPPTVNISKGTAPPRTTTAINPSANGSGEDAPAGFVQSLRSSWEKKSQNVPVKPVAKTGSANTPLSTHELSGSYSPCGPSNPITKTGSGPPGVVLSSPGIKKPSPPPTTVITNHTPTSTPFSSSSPTTKFSRTFHSPLVKTGSSPLITASSTFTTTTNTNNVAAGTTSQINTTQQNGITPRVSSYTKGSVTKRMSSFEPTAQLETEVKQTNGTGPSPRLLRRPASLYVSSSNSTDNKQLSSLISILQEKTSSSPPPPATIDNKLSAFPKNKLEQFQKRETSPNIVQPSERPSLHKIQRSNTISSPIDRRSKKAKLLRWCQIMTKDYDNVCISNFGESFSNGLAFCALLHHFVPDKIPYSTLTPTNQRHNFTIAFKVADDLGIPSLLDIDDMVELEVPDWMSVMTYVSYIYQCFPKNT